jgi:hypothetical protein
LRVVTVSVTCTVTEVGPAASLVFGVPDSTPAVSRFCCYAAENGGTTGGNPCGESSK